MIYLYFQLIEHGFPSKPSALAFDPKLKLLAIGTKSGVLRVYPFFPCDKCELVISLKKKRFEHFQRQLLAKLSTTLVT